jgi:hypothetical protein
MDEEGEQKEKVIKEMEDVIQGKKLEIRIIE